MSNSITYETFLEIKNDSLHIGCCQRAGYLTQWIKSGADNKIKPYGTVSKIVIPLTRYYAEESSESVPRVETTTAEKVIKRNIGDVNLY